MATWNQSHWNQPVLWGPPPLSPTPATTTTHQRSAMKRQRYFPEIRSQQPEWFTNYADKVTPYATTAAMPAGEITETVKEAKFCAYTSGTWLAQAKEFYPACFASLEHLYDGSGASPLVLPVFTAPVLPAGVVPVAPGALKRIFRFVADLKNKSAYTEAMGEDLGLIGPEETPPNVPKFSLKLGTGEGCECAELRFFKYGRLGVIIECRRNGGPWEFLAIDTESPYTDARPLLVPGTAEVREYRLRLWDGAPIGDFTAVQRLTVGPL